MIRRICECRTEQALYDHLIIRDPRSERERFARDTHNEFELLLFVRGDVTYVIEDRRYKLRRHDLVIIHPSRYHYLQIDGDADYERYNLSFPVEWLAGTPLEGLSEETEVVSCERYERIVGLFEKLDDYVGYGEEAFTELLSSMIRELFYNLLHQTKKTAAPTARVSPLVSSALRYINENLYTLESVEEISSSLYGTEIYFFRAFKKEMKISPMRYVTNKRLLAAQKRIDAGERPTDVYLQCGFNTYTAFYKRYVEFFGLPPSGKTRKIERCEYDGE